MQGMRERVERIGGTLHVTSHQAAGTVIETHVKDRQAGLAAERLGGTVRSAQNDTPHTVGRES
jgi:signal transduction histidine kinase